MRKWWTAYQYVDELFSEQVVKSCTHRATWTTATLVKVYGFILNVLAVVIISKKRRTI